jgi:hypothetical protein
MKNPFFKHLEHFAAKTEISYEEMRRILLNTQNTGRKITVYATKKDGTNFGPREVNCVDGPGGNAMSGVIYWRAPYYYMIVDTDEGFRTVLMKTISKLKVDGRTLYVR